MLEVNGLNIEKLPFEGMEIANELLYFQDSPMLIHLTTEKKEDLIAYWVDFDNTGNRWMYGKLQKQELFQYLIGSKSLKQLFLEISSDYVFLVDTDIDDNINSVKLINNYNIPEKYFPSADSFYKDGLSEYYSDYLTHFNYINVLKESSYIFNIESSDDAHENTVGAREAAFVLNNISNSIEGYIKVKANSIYSQHYADTSRIKRRVNQVKDRLSPRIAQTFDHSFEVWLAMDIVTFQGDNQYDAELRNGIVEGYKQDVLDVDFTSEQDAKIIAAKFNPSERKMIYEPLIRVLDNEDIKVTITDYKQTIKRSQKNLRTASSFKDIIFPKPTLEELEEELKKKNKIISIVLNLKEGEDVSKISKKTLTDHMVFSEDIGETPLKIETPIDIDGNRINIKKSLICKLKVDPEGDLEIYNSDLEISANGTDLQDVLASIKRQFLQLVQDFKNNKEIAGDKLSELQKYI